MSKIVFFGFPAHGHTNPTLPVVSELVCQGHEVFYYSYNFLREKIESTGANFISCDNFDSKLKLTEKDAARIGKDIAFSTKLLVDTTLALDEKVSGEMAKLNPDCIVADSMALWGKAIALKLGIPFVSSTTTFAFNKHSAKVMKQSLGELLKMILSIPKTNKQVKRLTDRGYPVKSILDIIANDEKTDTIVYTSPQFQPFSDTFPENYSFIGPCIRPAYEILEKKKSKRVYISMGTVNNDMLSFYKTCISALAKTDYEVVISVGDKVSLEHFANLPENITIFPFVDQIAVLNETDVFVTHAGMNSVSESLYFEVPLIMIPQTSEQKGVASRVENLGAGLVLDKVNSDVILTSVNRIISDSNFKLNAKKISSGFKICSGAKGAADKILECAKN